MSRQYVNHYNILLTFLARSIYLKPTMGIERTFKLYQDNNNTSITNVSISNAIDSNASSIIERFISLYPIKIWKEHGFFDESYLNEINEHWLHFVPPDRKNHLALAGCYILIMIVGIFGNLFVIILFIR